MKISLLRLSVLALSAGAAGCSTIYQTAVDKRSVGEQLSDTRLKAKIEKKYIDDPDVKALDISPYVYLGNVYLVGEYRNETEKKKILSIPNGMEGVRSLTSFLFVKEKDGDPCGAGERLKLKAKVKGSLIADKSIMSTNVDVDTVQCHVVLLGYVGTQDQIDRSIAHAKGVAGVKSVKSYLQVLKK